MIITDLFISHLRRQFYKLFYFERRKTKKHIYLKITTKVNIDKCYTL